jgi:hypothetical protein
LIFFIFILKELKLRRSLFTEKQYVKKNLVLYSGRYSNYTYMVISNYIARVLPEVQNNLKSPKTYRPCISCSVTFLISCYDSQNFHETRQVSYDTYYRFFVYGPVLELKLPLERIPNFVARLEVSLTRNMVRREIG